MFFWYDYLMLVITLFSSTLIGLYFGCFGTKQSTTTEYLFGGKKMQILPIGLSVAVSHFSAVTLIGVPTEVYNFGAFYWFTCLSQLLTCILAIYVYYPVFFKIQLTTAYEYLERRFDRKTRLLASFLFILHENVTLPVTIYGPALALSAVTDIKVSVIAFVISLISVFYTAVGGLRTVVWTDIFQFVIIITSVLVVISIGVVSAGGFSAVWNTALAGGRLEIFDFDLDPTKKDSFWLYTLGFTFHWLAYVNLSQSTIQKFLSLSTFRDCLMSLLIYLIGLCVVITLSVLLGLIIYARFAGCDPLASHKITKNDEIVSYYVAEITENIPCLSGLFMAALVSAAISTISSTLNSLSGVIYKDFISKFSRRQFTEKSAVFILKLIVVTEGILCTSLVLWVEHSGEIIPLIVRLSGMVNGPLLGLFTLGILFPRMNAKSAFCGAICGLIFISVVSVPANYYNYHQMFHHPTKPISVDSCDWNQSINNGITSGTDTRNTWTPFFLFRISYYYYCLIGAVVTITTGFVINQVINRNGPCADRDLISPVCHFLLPNDKETNPEALQTLVNTPKDNEN